MILIFDLGATHFRYTLAEKGHMGAVEHSDTDSSREGFEDWLKRMARFSDGQKLEAIVGGMAGQLEGQEGRLAGVPNLPNWHGLPVRRRMQELFNCPVYIENDVVMAGLGEAHDGAGTMEGVMAYFTISTGVNAVRLVDGEVDDTISRFELGRQLLEEDTVSTATLEGALGGAATEARYGRPPRELHDDKLWATDERILARALYNTVLYWAPSVMVCGGAMMRDIDLGHVEQILRELPQPPTGWPALKMAALGDLGGLHGALRWWQHLRS